MDDGRPALPDPATALTSAAAWANDDAKLAALLRLGLGPGDAIGRWGVDLLRTNRVADAATAFRTALALSPQTPVLWTHFGVALDRGGSLGEAAACFERALELDRHQIDTWLLLGMSKKRLGDRSGAGTAYRAALELEPHSAVVWQCLGLLEEEQRDYPAAIECFEACVRHGAPSAAVFANLGKLYYQVGRIVDAHAAYTAAAERDPGNAHYALMRRKAQFLRDVLRGDAVTDALRAYASPAGEAGREHDALLEAACAQLGSFGEIDAAIRVARTRVDLSPGSVTANYLLRALRNEPGVDRSPQEYIVESFDAFADGFDAKLVGVLGYDVPDKLAALIRDGADSTAFLDVLDAGCGTGLCGRPLRPLAGSLTGVDLSPKMLERARERGVYDALVCADLLAFLARSAGRFDLVASADVVIYFGETASLFAAAAKAMRPGGVFAFSTEHGDGDGYRLLPSGRFAHAPSYIRSVASPDFVEERCDETTLRLEANGRVRGNLYRFRRR